MELVPKTNENTLNKGYQSGHSESCEIAELQQRGGGVHEQEQNRIMELERMLEELSLVKTRSAQLEANLAFRRLPGQGSGQDLLINYPFRQPEVSHRVALRISKYAILRSYEQETQGSRTMTRALGT
ncbi:hypothetical protein BGX34_001265 [Mortierella sp. NVP85]|nr:hypothetical protein BGX34_001265 [Mortierella sp. NVP85]